MYHKEWPPKPASFLEEQLTSWLVSFTRDWDRNDLGEGEDMNMHKQKCNVTRRYDTDDEVDCEVDDGLGKRFGRRGLGKAPHMFRSMRYGMASLQYCINQGNDVSIQVDAHQCDIVFDIPSIKTIFH